MAELLEIRLHCAVVDHLARLAVPGWFWSHIPSGGLRSKETARLMKRLGLKRGLPDLVLIGPEGRHHYLELKRQGGRLTEDQAAFLGMCGERGISARVCYGYEEAIEHLETIGAVKKRARLTD